MNRLMSWTDLRNKLHAVRFPLAALAIGAMLLLISGKGGESSPAPVTEQAATAVEETVSAEKRLEDLLRRIDGVGEVDVLLSCSTSAVTEYVSDGDETVIVSTGSGKQEGLVRYTRYPQYLGAVIVCDGGGSADVRLYVTQAVSQFTGLSSDRITVLARRK